MPARKDDRPFRPQQLGILGAACSRPSKSAWPESADPFRMRGEAPAGGKAFFKQTRAARVERLDRLPGDLQPFLVAEGCELLRIVVVGPARNIGRDKHAAVVAEAVGGVDDVLVCSVGPGEASEDIVVAFPE